MKKLFILASAALMLAACNNDVKIDENTAPVGSNVQKEIALTSYAQGPKRVKSNAPVQGTEFPAQDMEVAAYLSAGATPGDYFSKATFSKDVDTWKGGKYWPLSAATLNFFAVSGTGVAASDITIASELASAGVTYTTAKSKSATTQSDIMYAFGRGTVSQSDNALVFPTSVPMAFKHALALINFQIKGSTAIQVKKIELNGARYTGTLALANSAAVTAASGDVTTTVTWTPEDVVDGVDVPNIENHVLTASLFPTNANVATATDWASLMIIPTQQKDESPVSYGFTTFTITYCIKKDAENYGPDMTYTYAPAGYTTGTPNLTAVQAGYKYNYQITMTLHEIEIAPEVTEWADGGTTTVNIPDPLSIGSNATFAQPATGGTYTFEIGGLDGDAKPVIDASGSSTSFSSAPTSTIPAAKVSTITYTIPANTTGSARTFSFTITDDGTGKSDKSSTITINQEY